MKHKPVSITFGGEYINPPIECIRCDLCSLVLNTQAKLNADDCPGRYVSPEEDLGKRFPLYKWWVKLWGNKYPNGKPIFPEEE